MASVPTGGNMATPALITAGGQVGSAAVGSYGNKKAAQAQERSNAAALAYTKEKDALTRQDALRHEALWQQQQNQWRNAANQALANWGFEGTLAPISGYGPEATPMGSSTAATPRGSVLSLGQLGRADPQAIKDALMAPWRERGGVPSMGNMGGSRQRNAYADLIPTTEGDGRDLTNELGDWSDWRRYNLG